MDFLHKPGFQIVFVGRTVLGKTVNDRKDQMETTERLAKTVSDPQRPAKTESLRVAEIETSSIPATLKDP